MPQIARWKELEEIEPTLVQVSEAIVSVLHVEVTIVDTDYRRIAGTGRYAGSIGETLAGRNVFERAMVLRKSQVVKDPRQNSICTPCENKAACEETAQVCCPIISGGEVVGIMGLAAFSDRQRDLLLSNEEGMLGFAESMAGLIASKVNENREVRHVQGMALELGALLDYMDVGVITTDGDGRIFRINSIADEMLGISAQASKAGGEIGGISIADIESLADGLSLALVKKRGGRVSKAAFSYRTGGGVFAGFYDAKPIELGGHVRGYLLTLTKASEMLAALNAVSGGHARATFDDILGASVAITQAKETARTIALGSSTVLIQGESGTGKELFARAIHEASARSGGPFVAINCSAIPESLMESELFGYEEGAFTGARKGGRMGKFELASKGTIFLDEIGDMPLNLQMKLLRVLQENAIERVGGSVTIPIDVRVVSATNRNLDAMVEEREFRHDLYYRLNVIPLFLPPLRERLDDVELMASCFLQKYSRKLGRNIDSIDKEVIKLFLEYGWPGNVRELENAIEFAVNMCRTRTIEVVDLPRKLRDACAKGRTSSTWRTLAAIEREEILRAVKAFGSPDKAAAVLGIGRATIYRKMKTE